MNHRDHHHKHKALMLLACAFAFVYLLAWEFQGSDITRRWNSETRQNSTQTKNTIQELPPKLEMIDEQTLTSNTETGSGVQQISFTSLNAIPQSFIRLGISSTAGIMMDTQRVIVTTNTNTLKRTGETKTMTLDQIKQIGLNVDSLTFYNDSSWANILVIMEVVRNQQSFLIQVPYTIWRDDKAHLNMLITQLTQK